MKVFLSWSGERSKYIATAFRDWLPMVLQAVEPWISIDIEKGIKWNDALSKALKESKICILCLTKDNIKSQYIHYEAGVISGNENSHNCTFLFDVKETDVTNPLSAFQNTKFDKDDIFKLICDINRMLIEGNEVHLKDALLKKNFELHWPSFMDSLKQTPDIKEVIPSRTPDDILVEILQTVRNLDEKIDKSKTSVKFDPEGVKPVLIWHAHNIDSLKKKDNSLKVEDRLEKIKMSLNKLEDAKFYKIK